MGLEYRIRPKDTKWMAAHRGRVEAWIRALPSFVEGGAPPELWLKDPGTPGDWAFDVRLFPEEDALFVEVSSKSPAFFRDARALHDRIAGETPVSIEDADDPDEQLDADKVFRAPAQH